jgi:hypothetical protein
MIKFIQKYKAILIVGILVVIGIGLFVLVNPHTKIKFVPNCTDTFVIPKQNNAQRFIAIPGHFDMFTADEQYFVDSKLIPLYPTQEKAINKFISSLQCGDELFLKLVSISPDFATGEAELMEKLKMMKDRFESKNIFNLQNIQTKCGEFWSFESGNKKYYTRIFLDYKPDIADIPYQKLTITFPLETSLTYKDCI